MAERGNNRISVFEADGEFIFAFGYGVDSGASAPETCTAASGCQAGIAGSAAGQLVNPVRIAVDNVAGSPARHDIYVVTSNFRWQRFKPSGEFVSAVGWGVDTGANALESCTAGSGCQAGIKGSGLCQLSNADLGLVDPVAVGPSGNVFVADSAGSEPNFTSRVEKFSPGGSCLGETPLISGNAVLQALAVDSSEDAYVSVDRVSDTLRKYDLGAPETKLCSLDPGINTNALAINDSGQLFASQREKPVKAGSNEFQVVTEYGSACNDIARFGYGQIEANLRGLAYLPRAEGDLFGSEEGGAVHYLKIPAAGPIVATADAGPVGVVKATIRAEINPEGKETQVYIEYVDQAHFEAEGFNNPKKSASKALTAGFGIAGAEFQIGCNEPLSEGPEGKCLAPEAEYRFRVVATSADNPTGAGEGTLEGAPFKTPPHIKALWVSGVGTDTATLSVSVDPLGLATSGYFEYVDDATFQVDKLSGDGFQHATKVPAVDAEVPQTPLDFGAGDGAVSQSAIAFPLTQDTLYHYRAVVKDPIQELAGEAQSFQTFGVEEGQICPANAAFRTGAGALLPDCRAYEMVSPLDKEGGEIVVQTEAFTNLPATVDQASISGLKLTYGSYRAFGNAKAAPYTSQYLAERDPEAGWLTDGISPPHGASIMEGGTFDNEFRAFSADLCEGWVTPFKEPTLAPGAVAGYFNLYRREDGLCGPESYEAISTAKAANRSGTEYNLELQGYSAGGDVAAFVANGSLEGTGAPVISGASRQLYAKQRGGGVTFVCVLPGGAPSGSSCSAGTNIGALTIGNTRQANVANSVWGDGKGIFWTNSNTDGRIFLRKNPFGVAGECSGSGAPCTVAVSKVGEEASGTSASHYWGASENGSVAIFETDEVGKVVSDLYEYEVGSETTRLIAHKSLGVLGMSEDASRVYFASGEDLTPGEENSVGEEATEGKANLYLYEAGTGTYRFIATLSSADASDVATQGASTALAREPIGHNGQVSADGTRAVFMSSAPLTGFGNSDAVSGKADTEVFLYDAGKASGKGRLVCVSCNPSGGRPAGEDLAVAGAPPFWVAARLPTYEDNFHVPRVLSEDGSRLFFESVDPLVARDTNGRIDVYQWEELGAGGENGCREGDMSFSVPAAGCISLVSSGQSLRNAELVDSGASGSDVFFTTLASLVPQDYGLVDIYDARVGGGFPAPPSPPAECEGEACQSPAAAPQFQTPSSATYNTPAGRAPEAKKPIKCSKGKHKVKKNGKTKCVKKKNDKSQKKANRQKRANTDPRAGA